MNSIESYSRIASQKSANAFESLAKTQESLAKYMAAMKREEVDILREDFKARHGFLPLAPREVRDV